MHLQHQDWNGQSGATIISEICGFVVVLSGTILLQVAKDFERSSSFREGNISPPNVMIYEDLKSQNLLLNSYAANHTPGSPSLSTRLCTGNGELANKIAVAEKPSWKSDQHQKLSSKSNVAVQGSRQRSQQDHLVVINAALWPEPHSCTAAVSRNTTRCCHLDSSPLQQICQICSFMRHCLSTIYGNLSSMWSMREDVGYLARKVMREDFERLSGELGTYHTRWNSLLPDFRLYSI
uniref:Uncharacterized protein n=1 Tax=Cucumis melo TaxID=3656 RepID=A0A9I9E6N5_CUCME